tara:strand:- start:120 stop:308 length:189 start_codon:yes stop_codon:yes gene_type:complete
MKNIGDWQECSKHYAKQTAFVYRFFGHHQIMTIPLFAWHTWSIGVKGTIKYNECRNATMLEF